MARQAMVASPPLPVLSINDLRFVNAYQERGFKSPAHIDAYQSLHPGCKRASARVGAERILQKVCVKEEIARRLRVEAGWTRENAVSACLSIRDRAASKDALDTELRAVAELNELAGLKVQKVEDVTERPVERAQVLDALRTRGLLPVSVS